MSNLRQAAQQMLDAISNMSDFKSWCEAKEALQAALKHPDQPDIPPKQEPIAWIYQNSNTGAEYLVWRKSEGGRNWRPLYIGKEP